MPSPIFMSGPPTGFSFLAILRGLQLTFLGPLRAVQNPYLSKRYYRKAALAILLSVLIQLALWGPIWSLQVASQAFAWASGKRLDIQPVIDTCHFLEDYVLNIGLYMIMAVHYAGPDMDELFLHSLQYFDSIYKSKHPDSSKEYYGPLQDYTAEEVKEKVSTSGELLSDRKFRTYIQNYLKSSALTLALYMLSGSPVIGSMVLPAAIFYEINKIAGSQYALTAIGIAFMTTNEHLVVFLSALWGGQSLVRELLSPYFARVPFSRTDKDYWFRAREGILLSYGFGFYWLLKTPFLGVLIYGIAEASTAYLISKVSEPPPAPGPQLFKWVENEVIWTSQSKFLSGATLDEDGFGFALPLGPVDW